MEFITFVDNFVEIIRHDVTGMGRFITSIFFVAIYIKKLYMNVTSHS